MTISAKKHNAIVRMLGDGMLSIPEIASRAKASEGAVRARRGAELKDEPLWCHRHRAETSVEVFRENVENGLPGCVMCAAEEKSKLRQHRVDEDGDLGQCQLGLEGDQAVLAEKIRSGEVVIVGKRKGGDK